jgi:pyruvate/2-oxoglutarate dehydrogenase complex dihydrolipoamide dehydrogenase (E3) component
MGMSASEPQAAAPATAEPDSENVSVDMCIIGAGPAGLAAAAGAAAFGRSVVVLERHKVGGHVLNYGCIPAAALSASADRAQAMRTAGEVGLYGFEPDIDPRSVRAHSQKVAASLAPNYSAERFAGLGVRVIRGAGRFINKRTVMAGELKIRARRFVIATGTTPLIPTVSGLDNVPYFTTETIFDSQDRLHNLIVLGGGPVALSLAQTYSRLGSRVIVLEEGTALADEDPELGRCVVEKLGEEGIGIIEGAKIDGVEGTLGRVSVNITVDGEKHVVEGSHLLVAVGRKPATADLGLEAAGIRHDAKGIKVGRSLKTSNRRVFAIGDVTGCEPYAHVADYHAEVAIRRAMLHAFARVDKRIIPRIVFTRPELAWVGLSEAEAAKQHGRLKILRWPYRENDRAEAEGKVAGHIKVIARKDGRIVGAGIVGEHAGELIQIWGLAISQGLNLKAMTSWIPPYPTLSEINKRVAASYYAAAPSNPTLRKVVDFFAKFG